MIRWTPYPFIRILLFFLVGIVAGVYFPGNPAIVCALTCAALAAYLILVQVSGRADSVGILGSTALITIFLFGYFHVIVRTDARSEDHIIHVDEAISSYKVVICGGSAETAASWKTVGEVTAVRKPEGWTSVSGKVLLYTRKSEFESPFAYGDELLISGAPSEIPPPYNPHEFDYRKFMSVNRIYHQDFPGRDRLIKIGNVPPSLLIDRSIAVRQGGTAVLRRYLSDREVCGVVEAMVLGVKDDLDDNLVQSYAGAGVLHILAVSGLHVGVIYWLALIVFRPLQKFKFGPEAISVLTTLVLWGYAFVTGLSPSVLRAVTMFSLFAVARIFNRQTSVYNVLACSAFLLLIVDPYLIFSVGFQLSYLAVFGIIYFYPRFYNLWIAPNWITDKVWQMISVSLAAQLATGVLSVYYFNQFPVYFLPGNILIIPVAFLVLAGGILLLMISPVPAAATIVSSALNFIVQVLNATTAMLNRLPGSVIRDISLDGMGMIVLILGGLFLVLLFERKRFSALLIAFSFMMIFSGWEWYRELSALNQVRLIVYRVPGGSVIDLFAGHRCYEQANGIEASDVDYAVRPNRMHSFIREISKMDRAAFYRSNESAWWIEFAGRVVMGIGNIDSAPVEPIRTDYLILSENAVRSLDDLGDKFIFKTLIIDSSNSFRTADHLLKEATDRGVAVHSVLHNGAWVAVLESDEV